MAGELCAGGGGDINVIALSALPWRAIGLGLVAALLAAAGWLANGWRLGEQLSNLQATYATEQRNQALVQINAVDRATRRTAPHRGANESKTERPPLCWSTPAAAGHTEIASEPSQGSATYR